MAARKLRFGKPGKLRMRKTIRKWKRIDLYGEMFKDGKKKK